MKPIVKYQGGKTREIKTLMPMVPTGITGRVIEPFCGGAAFMFHMKQKGVLSDVNRDIINLYTVVQGTRFTELHERVQSLKSLEGDALRDCYYAARSLINRSWQGVDEVERAAAYIVVRQLCFSGMERYNSRGEFNTPFGHYSRMACAIGIDHHQYLKGVEIKLCDFEESVASAQADDFIFLDPPYLDRLGYAGGDGSDGLHGRLFKVLTSTPARWLLVHSDHEFYRRSYSAFHTREGSFGYAQRFGKNKDHSGASVTHLYITNYSKG